MYYHPGQWLENRVCPADVLSSWSVARKPSLSRRCINYHPGQWLENREFVLEMYYHSGQWLEKLRVCPGDVLSSWSVARKPSLSADVLSSWSVARKPSLSRRCINYHPGQWLENREFVREMYYHPGQWLENREFVREMYYHPGQWLENRVCPGDVLIIILVSG